MLNARTLLSATAIALLMTAPAFAVDEDTPTEGPIVAPGVNEPGLNEPAAEVADPTESMGYTEDMVPEGAVEIEDLQSEALDEVPSPGVNEPGINEPAEERAEDEM